MGAPVKEVWSCLFFLFLQRYRQPSKLHIFLLSFFQLTRWATVDFINLQANSLASLQTFQKFGYWSTMVWDTRTEIATISKILSTSNRPRDITFSYLLLNECQSYHKLQSIRTFCILRDRQSLPVL